MRTHWGSLRITVTIEALNNTPVAQDSSITVDENGSQTIDVASLISDADGDTLTVTVANGSLGTTTVNGTAITYQNTQSGSSDSFVYTVDDGNAGSDTGTISVTINSAEIESGTAMNFVIAINEATNFTTQLGGVDYGLTVSDCNGQTMDWDPINSEPNFPDDVLIPWAPEDVRPGNTFNFSVCIEFLNLSSGSLASGTTVAQYGGSELVTDHPNTFITVTELGPGELTPSQMRFDVNGTFDSTYLNLQGLFRRHLFYMEDDPNADMPFKANANFHIGAIVDVSEESFDESGFYSAPWEPPN